MATTRGVIGAIGRGLWGRTPPSETLGGVWGEHGSLWAHAADLELLASATGRAQILVASGCRVWGGL